MDVVDIAVDDDCQEICGTICLTFHGNLEIYCTLCENKFNCFDDFAAHVKEHIISPDLLCEENEFLDLQGTENFRNFDEYDDIPEYENEEFNIKESRDEVDFDCDSSTEVESLDIGNENGVLISNEEQHQEAKSPFTPKKYTPKLQEHQPTPNSRGNREQNKKCPHCDFSCSDKSNLLGHIKRHSNNKPYKCTDCNKAFYTRTELKSHIRTHTKERPFLCMECGKTFGTSSKLTMHLKRHANLRDQQCPLCEMKFYNTSHLRGHMVIHSKERPLKCNFCEASFKSHACWRNHQKLHENARKYKCTLCQASFNQNAGLYSHMKKRHSVVKGGCKLSDEL